MRGSLPGAEANSATLLEQIARALGCPVSAFHDAGAPERFADTAELLRLWSALPTDEDRTKVLVYARSLTPGLRDVPPVGG